MTCGIYILKFKGTNQVYVGQSVDIEYRYKKHLQNLKNGKHNYKMLRAYEKYGLPSLETILDDLTEAELSSNEKLAFQIFNSIDDGFNVSSETSISESGELNPGSKYTNKQIEAAFLLLLDTSNTFNKVHEITGVSVSTIRHIANLEAHRWLKEKYPDKYKSLIELKVSQARRIGKNTAAIRGIIYPKIVSPEGIEYTVTNIAEFAKTHNLDSSCIAKVLKRVPRYNSHKGWHLKI